MASDSGSSSGGGCGCISWMFWGFRYTALRIYGLRKLGVDATDTLGWSFFLWPFFMIHDFFVYGLDIIRAGILALSGAA